MIHIPRQSTRHTPPRHPGSVEILENDSSIDKKSAIPEVNLVQIKKIERILTT